MATQNRNPLTEGKKIVTMRIAGPASYSTGGDTWTFKVARNVRRVLSLIEDPAAAKSGGDSAYICSVLVNDGQGNTRTVQVYDQVVGTGTFPEVTATTDLSSTYFIATLELAEGV